MPVGVEIGKAHIVGQAVGKVFQARRIVSTDRGIHEGDLRRFPAHTAELRRLGKGLPRQPLSLLCMSRSGPLGWTGEKAVQSISTEKKRT
ncbi:hypothetical protein BEL01nite_59690 [Bradyrhizobium elkanii]|nr:hypothetical protein BEL01nite_59690 [Bradyrhizobium elkanii]